MLKKFRVSFSSGFTRIPKFGVSLQGKRGFTLIELLVVIAIIGILSAVVLTQLNSARGKAGDAQKKANFKNLINHAIFYYETNDIYTGICNDGAAFQNTVEAAGVIPGDCRHGPTSYRVMVQLQSGDWMCVDATGNIKMSVTKPTLSPNPC